MSPAGLHLRPLQDTDWPSVRAIYAEGIATGNATFETEPPGWEVWNAAHLAEARWVAQREGSVVGWAALSPVSSRCVYRGVAEVSVYVTAAARGAGVGRALLAALIQASEAMGIWTLRAGIFPKNTASAALHLALGFRLVGVQERLGELAGVWRNVALYERRSPTVGG